LIDARVQSDAEQCTLPYQNTSATNEHARDMWCLLAKPCGSGPNTILFGTRDITANEERGRMWAHIYAGGAMDGHSK
jgi:hypothetical protein